MSYIRRKKVKGKVYLYEVEGKRDKETGKVKQRVIRYIGPAPSRPELGTTNEDAGDTPTAAPSSIPRRPLTWRDGVMIGHPVYGHLGDWEVNGFYAANRSGGPGDSCQPDDPALAWIECYSRSLGETRKFKREQVTPRRYESGDRVLFPLFFNGKQQQVSGEVAAPPTQGIACMLERGPGNTVLFSLPGCVGIRYQLNGRTALIQLPLAEVSIDTGEPAGHGKEPNKTQLKFAGVE